MSGLSAGNILAILRVFQLFFTHINLMANKSIKYFGNKELSS